MKITSLTLDNVRGIEHLELKDLPDKGVILISGENEEGKSTLLEAIHAVFTIKHRSGSKEIRALKTIGKDEPVHIAVEASIGPYTLRIDKNYLKSKSAVLDIYTPTRENYSGVQAEDKLADILDSTVDADLRKALFVQQGELDAAITAAGIPSVAQALEAGSGADVCDADSSSFNSALSQAVEEELSKYYTKRKMQPSAEFKACREATEKARERLSAAQAETRALAAYLARHDKLERDMNKREADLEAQEEKVRAADLRLDQCRAGEKDKAEALAALELVRATLAAERQTLKQHEEEDAELQRLEKQLDTMRRQFSEQKEDLEQFRSRLGDARRELEHSEHRVRETRGELERWRAHESGLALMKEHDTNQEFLAELERLNERYSELLRSQADNAPDEAAVKEAERLKSELDKAVATQRAASPRLSLTAENGQALTINGDPVEIGAETMEQCITQRTVLRIGDVELVIEPAADLAGVSRSIHNLRADIAELLAAHDVETLADLRLAYERASDLHHAIDQSAHARTVHIGDRDVEALRAAVANFTAPDLPEDLLADPHPTEQVAARLAELAETLKRHEQSRKAAEAHYDTLADSDVELQAARAEQACISQAENYQRALEKKTQRDASESPQALAERIAQLEEESAARSRDLAELEERFPAEESADAEQLSQLAHTTRDSIEHDLYQSRNEYAELRGRIEAASGAAEEERLARNEYERCAASLASMNKRAAAVRLIKELLDTHRRAAQQRYTQPFVDEVSRLSAVVFGSGVDYEVDENMAISTRIADSTPVEWNALSAGAKEQLALFTRFALVGVLRRNPPRGERTGDTTLPIFIDDALGHTDHDRLVRMGAAFNDAAEDNQVFILTCVPQRYDSVKKERCYTMRALKE